MKTYRGLPLSPLKDNECFFYKFKKYLINVQTYLQLSRPSNEATQKKKSPIPVQILSHAS